MSCYPHLLWLFDVDGRDFSWLRRQKSFRRRKIEYIEKKTGEIKEKEYDNDFAKDVSWQILEFDFLGEQFLQLLWHFLLLNNWSFWKI